MFKRTINTHFLSYILALLCVSSVLSLLLSIGVDKASGSIRAGAFTLALIVTSLSSRGILIVPVTALWFEIPVLWLGFPNQFLIEPIILGAVLGYLFKARKDETHSTLLHPFFLPLIGSLGFLISSNLVSLWELKQWSWSGLRLWGIANLVGREAWLWKVESSPIHTLATLQGYGLQFLLIYCFGDACHKERLSLKSLLSALIFGTIPVSIVALGQKFFPEIVSNSFTIDYGGTLQNGNLLSYCAGLTLLLIPFAWSQSSVNLAYRIMLIAAGFLSSMAFLIGQGRAAWGAFLICFVLIFFTLLFFKLKNGQQLKKIWGYIGYTAGMLMAILIAFWGLDLHQWVGTKETIETIRSGKFLELIFNGGRDQHYQAVLAGLSELPGTGRGIGMFFQRSRTGFEIHNHFLDWAYGFGILPTIVFTSVGFLSITYFLRKTWHDLKVEKHQITSIVALAMSVYCFLMLLPDHYLTYRSVLSFTSLALIIPFYDIHFKFGQKLILPTFFAGIFLGALTFLNPHSLTLPNVQFQAESEEASHGKRSFYWNGPVMQTDLTSNSCLKFEIKFPQETTHRSIYASIISEAEILSQHASLSEVQALLKAPSIKEIGIKNSGNWTPICLCNLENRENRNKIRLFTTRAEILTLSKHFQIQDDRFIGFGISNLSVIPASEQTSECVPFP